jgi:hypothetical protein
MAAANLVMLNWNVRGLNVPFKRCALKAMVGAVKASLICLQEMKL